MEYPGHCRVRKEEQQSESDIEPRQVGPRSWRVLTHQESQVDAEAKVHSARFRVDVVFSMY